MAPSKKCKTPQELWEQISSSLVHFIEGIFFKLGVLVANNPWKTVCYTFIFVALSSLGLLKFHMEKNPMKLWVPPESDFSIDTDWFIERFQTGFRLQKLLVTGDNILTKEVLTILEDITTKVNNLNIQYKNQSYFLENLCFKIPAISTTRKLRSVSSNMNETLPLSPALFEPSLFFSSEIYCDILENFKKICLSENILDIWKYDREIISNLTQQDIINDMNTIIRSKPSSIRHHFNFTKSLGGITTDDSGNIIGAKSILLTWYTTVNFSTVDLDEVGNLVGTEEWVSMPLLLWEHEFLQLLLNYSTSLSNIEFYIESGRSFGDITGETMMQEIDKLGLGIFLMFMYIQIILSKCNWLEIRFTLGSVGLLSVGLAYVSACSWCSLFGISFGPVHSSLPFLLMGLGIDDMFVMKACWEQLTEEERCKSLPIKIGLMLKHAGVSIVITSFTDIVALLVGAVTILPSLKSFCIYAAVGVFFIFCYSVTFYVAIFSLDIWRIENNRNGIFYCYKHKEIIATSNLPPASQTIISAIYRKIIFSTPCKVLVIIFTIAMTAFSITGILKLEQKFDPKWFIPDGTYYKYFLDKYKFYYPNEGHVAMVLLGEMDYNDEFIHLHDLIQEIRKEPYVNELDTWVESFQKYTLKYFDKDLLNSTISNLKFKSYLSHFLFSSIGGRYQVNLRFSGPLLCGEPTPSIIASMMQFKFTPFSGPTEYLPAMNHIKHIVKSKNFTTGDGYQSVWSKAFANWVTDEIIATEVERNIELALLCVMFCTIILITNLQMCLWIFISVLLTLINVLGWMQRWNMTVDIVCCIGLELAIGLCVDYAAHVGHTFLTISSGTRAERSLKTVTSIGTAVLFGGGATLLSLSLLSMSKAYTFQSFFKIFLLVIVFGLFHGLIFLPVMLSLIGPNAYQKNKKKEVVENEIEVEEKSVELTPLKDPVKLDEAKC